MIWDIYIGMRETAREYGDPRLGSVEAETMREAEREAARGNWSERTMATAPIGAGFHAVPRVKAPPILPPKRRDPE